MCFGFGYKLFTIVTYAHIRKQVTAHHKLTSPVATDNRENSTLKNQNSNKFVDAIHNLKNIYFSYFPKRREFGADASGECITCLFEKLSY